ncbi:MAG: sigma-70 family RNA polymerase sigma factor [Myxococcales bacterium]|nr:sigma-70 family RNA polymerase sigma factor [Myxococcota bacterium]MDW8280209.1 sigma-70 family RNA polymerase sigma factor [Myxococcales bacterium]
MPDSHPPPADALPGHQVAALVARAQQGDVAAFEQLVLLYQNKIYTLARAFTSDPEEASDLAQEALIKVYRSIGGFRFQSSLSTWLFRIVKNAFLDHVKSRQSRQSQAEQRLEETFEHELRAEPVEHSAEEQLLRAEERAELWEALRRVPEVYRTVLVLCDMQGWSYEEIAAVVEAPLGTVKSRLKRGRDALRQELLAVRARREQSSHRSSQR